MSQLQAGKVHEAPLAVAGVESEDGEDEDLASSLTPEEFSRLKLEVERLGEWWRAVGGGRWAGGGR